MPLAVVDVDMVLLNPSLRYDRERDILLPAYKYAHLDRPIIPAKDLLRKLLDKGYKILLLTGRPMEDKPITIHTLIRFGFFSPEEYQKKVFCIHHPFKEKGISNLAFKLLVLKYLIKKGVKPELWIEDVYFYDEKSAYILKRVLERLNIKPLLIWKEEDTEYLLNEWYKQL